MCDEFHRSAIYDFFFFRKLMSVACDLICYNLISIYCWKDRFFFLSASPSLGVVRSARGPVQILPGKYTVYIVVCARNIKNKI